MKTDLWHSLVAHAQRSPDRVAFVLEDAPGSHVTVDYQTLVARSTSLAAALRERALPGDRALISSDSNESFIVGFFACLAAGVTAVPVASVADAGPALAQVRTARDDARPRFVICGAAARQRSLRLDGSFEQLVWISPDASGAAASDRVAHAEPAVILYTSASTARAKGVAIDHQGLVDTCERVQRLCEYTESSVNVSWTPPYHITGLICAICLPVYTGCRSILLPARAFAQRPLVWLETIDRWRGTHSGAPASCYELCVADARDAKLDLSSWRVAYLSGEPVRVRPLQRFAEAFERHGFKPHAFQACYGQSEGFRMAAAPALAGLKLTSFAAGELAQGRAVEVAAGDAVQLASHGPLEHPRHRIAIVDPETRVPCAPGIVGEIWVQGAGLASGYWDQPDATAATLGARTAAGDGPFLRTGDLGFEHGGNLYLSGRARNLVIVRGRNVQLEDVEDTVRAAIAAFQPAAIAIATVELDSSERLVVFVETAAGAHQPLAKAVREAVARDYGLSVRGVVVLPPRGMPRTGVGKIAKADLRNAYLRGDLREVRVTAEAAPEARSQLERELVEVWRAAFHADTIGTTDAFYALGGDSITLLAIIEGCRRRGLVVDALDVTRANSIAELATVVRTAQVSAAAAPAAVQTIPLLPSQTTMVRVFDHVAAHGHPDPTAYPMYAPVRLARAPIDVALFEQALAAVMDRYEAFRVRYFRGAGGAWVQELMSAPRKPRDIVERVDVSRLSASAQLDAIKQLREANEKNLELEAGEVVRVKIVARGDEGPDVVLWQTHHIITDVVTEWILHEELTTAYEQLRDGRPIALPPAGMPLSQWSQHVHRLDALGVFDDETGYWSDLEHRAARHRTAKFPIPSPISNDYPNTVAPPLLRLAGDDYTRLIARAKACGVGMFETMLAVTLRALERWAGAPVCIDLLHNGRTASAVADVTRTVGPIFYRFPLLIEDLAARPLADAIARVRDYMRDVPNRGLGYSMLGRRWAEHKGVVVAGRINYYHLPDDTHRAWNIVPWDPIPINPYQKIASPLRIGLAHIVHKELSVPLWGDPRLVDPAAIREQIAEETRQL